MVIGEVQVAVTGLRCWFLVFPILLVFSILVRLFSTDSLSKSRYNPEDALHYLLVLFVVNELCEVGFADLALISHLLESVNQPDGEVRETSLDHFNLLLSLVDETTLSSGADHPVDSQVQGLVGSSELLLLREVTDYLTLYVLEVSLN